MAAKDEDEIWRSIVENYGERAVLDDRPAVGGHPVDEQETAEIDPHHPLPPQSSAPRSSEPRSSEPQSSQPQGDVFGPSPRPASTPFTGPSEDRSDRAEERESQPTEDVDDLLDDEHRFVAPTPPLPTMERDRWIAWIAVLGSPATFVLAAILNQNLSGFVALVLALAFVGGFGWLVAHMPREPRDPWDDGARV